MSLTGVLQTLLRESMKAGLIFVHEMLLIKYVERLYSARREPTDGQSSDQATKRSEWDRVCHMDESYLTTGNVWQQVFRLEAHGGGEATLREVYERWRRTDVEGASVEWAKWLLGHGRGAEASRVVQGAGLEARWDELIAAVQ